MIIADILVTYYGRHNMKRFWLILAASLGLAATALPASADVTYTLNCGANPCSTTGNYGSVTLHQTSASTVTVTVDLTTAATTETFAGTGAGYAITWNITSDPTLSAVNITSANAANFTVQDFDPSDHSPPAPNYQRYKASPFTGGSCSFNDASCQMYAIDYNINGSGGSDNKLVFDVTLSSGLSIANFIANSAGYLFTVDISGGPCSPTCNVAAKVPEPATWLMFFAGLAGLTFMMQRRRKLARAA